MLIMMTIPWSLADFPSAASWYLSGNPVELWLGISKGSLRNLLGFPSTIYEKCEYMEHVWDIYGLWNMYEHIWKTGWWFGTWMDYFPFFIWDNPNPIDEVIFFKIFKPTNQVMLDLFGYLFGHYYTFMVYIHQQTGNWASQDFFCVRVWMAKKNERHEFQRYPLVI